MLSVVVVLFVLDLVGWLEFDDYCVLCVVNVCCVLMEDDEMCVICVICDWCG